jgi:hypothetical protein
MLVSRCQKAGQRQSIKIGNRSFESVAKFKYLRTTPTDQNRIHEEIKSRLNLGNASYHRLRLLVNRVLRRVFGPKTDEVTGEWRKLYNEDLHNLYSSTDIIRQVKSWRMRWAGHVARTGEERKLYKLLVGKPEGKRPMGRSRRRWENGIRMDLREIGLGGCGWDSTVSEQGPR